MRGHVTRAAILCVVGTRPEAVKLAPAILALRAQPGLTAIVCATGQHRDLLQEALAGFGIAPDIDLDLMQHGQSPADVVAASLPALMRVIAAAGPAAVLVQGDTATAFAAAQAAYYSGVPLGHVEAGLRSFAAEPFPEEGHRRAIAQLADMHFAPTMSARIALLAEGIDPAAVHVTGNSGIDALRLVEAAAMRHERPALPRLDPARSLVVVTIHRRENHGAPLRRVAAALRLLVENHGIEVVLPVHPHPAVSEPLHRLLGGLPAMHLVPPLEHGAFLTLLRGAALVLTDSGGVQEEAPALGVPALVLRDVTERGEGLVSGNAVMVGTDTATIIAAVRAVLDDAGQRARMSTPALPYGDGAAAPRIVAVLAARFASVPASAELVHQA